MFWLMYSLFLSLFLRFSSGSFCNPPCFTITPVSHLRVTQGEDIIIRWRFSANIPLQLAQWGSFDKDGKIKALIAQKHGNDKIEYSASSYKNRAVIEKDNSSMRLIDVKHEDSGYFGCTFKFQGGFELKNITNLYVASRSTGKNAPHEHRKLYWIFVGVAFLLVVLVMIYICLEHKKRKKLRQQSVKTARPQSGVLIHMDELDRGNPTDNDDNYHIIPPVGFNPATREWEVPRDNIVVIKVIGKGAFGLVAKGIVQLDSDKEDVIVAVKMLKKIASEEDKRDFLAELDLMKTLDHHPNVISLYGCVSKSEPYYMITEFVPFGDLLGHLRKSRGLKDTYFDDPDIKPVSSLTSRQLFTYSWHIANGMTYLSSKKIVHRDLAARNILVGEGEMCKITDFGLARDVHQQNVYTRTSKGRLPVKWTAYESLLYGECTTMSDVWSYGVVLYEIFTIGGSPFPKIEGKEVVSLLQEGQRMPKPKHLDKELYEVMMDCWQEKPDQRPTFATLREKIKEMESFHERYVRLSEYDSKLYENLDDLQV